MPRDNTGVYSLPAGAGNPVQQGTTITSSWANGTFNDVATALTNSLDRDGLGGMRAPFRNVDGTEAAPGITWSGDQASGFYLDGLGDMRASIIGQDNFRWRANGADIWADGAWQPIVYTGGPGGMPDGSSDYQSLSWNDTNSDWIPNSALLINYVSGTVTTASDLAVGGDIILATPGATVDGQDITANQIQQADHIGNSLIHFLDVDVNGIQYVRQNRNWIELSAIGAVMPDGTVEGETLRWDNTGGIWEVTDGLTIDAAGNLSASGTLGVSGNTSLSTLGVSGLSSLNTLNTTGIVGVGTATPNGASAIDIDGDIYTRGQRLIGGTGNPQRIEVRDSLPGAGSIDPQTIYLLTT
jgi:hypothetical protein